MSDFWTVTINRLQKVSKFDAAGVKISDTITKIPVTFCDLPYSTALMYKQKAPDDTVIVQQFREQSPTRKNFKERVNHYERAAPIPPKSLASEDLTPADATLEAAISGDFGAALTAEMMTASS